MRLLLTLFALSVAGCSSIGAALILKKSDHSLYVCGFPPGDTSGKLVCAPYEDFAQQLADAGSPQQM